MGTLTAAPSSVVIQNVAAGPVSVVATTTNNTGPITATLADGSFVTVSPSSISAATGTFTITPVNQAGGDDVLTFSDGVTTTQVPIALGASALTSNPGLVNLTSALAYIRLIADAPTLPVDADLTTMLNFSLTEVGAAISQVLSMTSLAIVFGTPTVTLPADILDIEKLGYSTNLPNVPGSIPYELIEIGPGEFMDFNAGVSSNYGLQPAGPVLYYVRLQDSFGRIRLMFSPLPPAGYLNITYHPRISWFVPGTGGSTVNLDPSLFEIVFLKTCQKVCQKQRDKVRADGFLTEYTQKLAEYKQTNGRRNNARTSVVRDVTSNYYNSMPPWYPS